MNYQGTLPDETPAQELVRGVLLSRGGREVGSTRIKSRATLFDLHAGNHPQMYFVRAIEEAHSAPPGPVVCKWSVRADPHGAKYLHGTVEHSGV